MKSFTAFFLLITGVLLLCTTMVADANTRDISRIGQLTHTDKQVGSYQALLIGIQNYNDPKIPDLETPLNDVREMETVLKEKYGFEVKTLVDENATEKAINAALRILAQKTKEQDSVLIYYAGHGELDRTYNDGWWIPVDAQLGEPTSYLDNTQVQKAMRSMKARHVLLISDSCYSGTLFGQTRALPPVIDNNFYLGLYNEKSRWGMTSGNKTPVSDSGTEGHSVFAYQLLKELKKNPKPFFCTQELYVRIAPIVSNNSNHTPICKPIRNTGDQGGQFIFIASNTKTPPKTKFRVTTLPQDAKVRIMNIPEKYYSGIELKAGSYQVEVSHPEYDTENRWIDVNGRGDKDLHVELTQSGPTPGQVWKEPVTGMLFVWVPKGCFQMGQTTAEKKYLIKKEGQETYDKAFNDEFPRHEVCLNGFWMGKYEVTRGMFRQFINASGYQTDAGKKGSAWIFNKETDWKWKDEKGYHWQKAGYPQEDNHPVVNISWNDAQAFIQWLNKTTGKQFTLPSEAQWEYACRGGTDTIRFWGDGEKDACRYANAADTGSNWSAGAFACDDGYFFTAPVGNYQSNGFGLNDMLGNVWEWCQDIYAKDAYKNHDRENPIYAQGGSDRVFRGGSWGNRPANVRCAFRGRNTPGDRGSYLGFRLLRTH